jgi:hypothetical protein
VAAGAVRDDGQLAGVDPVAGGQALAGGVGHQDHRVRRGHDAFEDRLLQRRRGGEHGVQDHDRRDGQVAQQRQHLVAVVTGVDAVLVLDDRHVEAVQCVRGPGPSADVIGLPGVHDPWCGEVGTRTVTGTVVSGQQPDHTSGHTTRREMGGECRIEGRQPALGGRIGAEKAVRGGHGSMPSW